jgi:hypothetical protein
MEDQHLPTNFRFFFWARKIQNLFPLFSEALELGEQAKFGGSRILALANVVCLAAQGVGQ